MTTKRQQYWLDAAEKESKRNSIAATLFWLIAQPNDQEQIDERRDDELRPESTR